MPPSNTNAIIEERAKALTKRILCVPQIIISHQGHDAFKGKKRSGLRQRKRRQVLQRS